MTAMKIELVSGLSLSNTCTRNIISSPIFKLRLKTWPKPVLKHGNVIENIQILSHVNDPKQQKGTFKGKGINMKLSLSTP
jgi:hypothetical protein